MKRLEEEQKVFETLAILTKTDEYCRRISVQDVLRGGTGTLPPGDVPTKLAEKLIRNDLSGICNPVVSVS